MLDKKVYAGDILMVLSKAFVIINYGLLVAKLSAYGFIKEAVELILSWLNNRKKRVKINKTFISWKELLCGVPQRSVLGPILLYIYLSTLFLILKKINFCNFTSDTFLLCVTKTLQNYQKNFKETAN